MEQTAERTSPRWLCLLGIVVTAAAGRLAVADHSLWFDEQASVFFSDQPFSRLWSDWMLRETNPALYYSALRIWRAILGSSDLAIRALSVGGSLVAMVLAYDIARRTYGNRAGLIAAGLAALSGQQLYFAEQARAYIFVFCAVLAALDSLLVFDAADQRESGWRSSRWQAAGLFAVAGTAAIYLHTTMLLFPPVVIAAVIASDPGRYWKRPLLPLLAAGFAILIASGWAVRQAVLQILEQRDNIAPIGLSGKRQMLTDAFYTLFLSGHAGLIGGIVALAVLVASLAFVVVDWRRRQTRLLAATGALALVVFAVIGRSVPIFVPRTIFWISAVPLVLTSAALARIPLRRWRWATLAVMMLLLALDTARVVPILQQADWNTPVRRIARQPNAMLVVQGEAMGVLSDSVCRRQLHRYVCPYTIVSIIDPQDHFDGWARGSFTGSQVPAAELASYAAGHSVFLFRKAAYHNVPDLLHRDGLGHGVPANGPALIGPLPAAALR